jgi:hypothetical protein
VIFLWPYKRPAWNVYLGTRLRWWRLFWRVCWVWPTRWCRTPWGSGIQQGERLRITTGSGLYDGDYTVTEVAVDQVRLR